MSIKPMAYLITEFKHQSQLFLTVHHIMKPIEQYKLLVTQGERLLSWEFSIP